MDYARLAQDSFRIISSPKQKGARSRRSKNSGTLKTESQLSQNNTKKPRWRLLLNLSWLGLLHQATVFGFSWIPSSTATSDLLISNLDITCLTPYFIASISSSREGKSVQIKMSVAGKALWIS